MRLLLALIVAAGGSLYRSLITGVLHLDLGVGRRLRPLGPLTADIAASRDIVFEVVQEPYMAKQTRALAEKIQILERGDNMVLAAHKTPLRGGPMMATTVETVRFTRPDRIDFRLVRGPVPHVVEQFLLTEEGNMTRLTYNGELGTDLWALGAWWGNRVAHVWDHTVAASLLTIKAESERRARPGGGLSRLLELGWDQRAQQAEFPR